MKRTRSLASGLLSFSAATVLALATAGGATAAPTPSGEHTGPSIARLAVENVGTSDYWTSERMENAVSGEVLAEKALERSRNTPVLGSAPTVEKGKDKKVKATKAKDRSLRAASPGSVSHIGKVFFTMAGSNYVCSGNAVSSANKSTVSTAGHCIIGGPGRQATNFTFVPAYENGKAPYGKWTAKDLFTTTQWSSSGNISYDTGFAVMNPLDGKLLTDVVGGSGVAFNQEYGLWYTVYGYPADQPFNGKSLKSCSGTASADTVNPEFTSQGIPCDMTSGASGGPWFMEGDSDALQNSVNSYGYSGSNVLYGPYWGTEIEAVYALASIS